MSKGITVGAWDPHLDINSFPEGVVSISDLTEAQDYDMVVLVTAHKACLELDWNGFLVKCGRRFFTTVVAFWTLHHSTTWAGRLTQLVNPWRINT
ncbi:MAG: hypothetical protein MG2_1766 [uncultured Candidatus Poseidoniales archaeon]|nr:MAG: hypothetical protein MG2_1766 [uncultured Candidatus Poseidoniales archaeon]